MVVLLSLAFLMPIFYYIPKASLASVIICAVAPMFDYGVALKLWRVKREPAELLCVFVCVTGKRRSGHLGALSA